MRKPKSPAGEPRRWLEASLESETDECIEWPFSTNGNGYGHLRIDGPKKLAHRWVLVQATGHDKVGMDAAHAPGICHNRKCVNKRHLRWASRKENLRDRKVDDTLNHGTRNGMHKLTEADVLNIRNSTLRSADLAEMFGVDIRNIDRARSGATWKHVGGATPRQPM